MYPAVLTRPSYLGLPSIHPCSVVLSGYPQHPNHEPTFNIHLEPYLEANSVADRILVTDLPPPHTISYGTIVPFLHLFGDRVVFTGLLDDLSRYSVLPIDERDIDLTIVVSAPSGDRIRYIVSILRLIKRLRGKDLNIVVIGDGRLRGVYDGVRMMGWVPDALEYIRRSRAVLLRGGQTAILESIMSGVPMLVSPAPRQTEQENNGLSERIVDMIANIDSYVSRITDVRAVALEAGGIEGAVNALIETVSI